MMHLKNSNDGKSESISLGPFVFRRVFYDLSWEKEIQPDQYGYTIRYTEDSKNSDLMKVRRGVYCISLDLSIVYVGRFSQGLAKRWLLLKTQRLYHKTAVLSMTGSWNSSYAVFAESEDNLRGFLNEKGDWVDSNSIEAGLIRKFKPQWNRQGLKD